MVALGLVGLVTTGCATSEAQGPAVAPATRAAVQAQLDALTGAGVVGGLATVSRGGETVEVRSGVGDLAAGTPIPATTQQVRVGSITKSFTAVMVLQLVGEGRVDLDAPIDTYLPGLITEPGFDAGTVTVRQILQHRSGLAEFSDDPRGDELAAARAGVTITPDEILGILNGKPAQFPAGTEFRYTNANYIVAGMLVERVTGRPYAEELQHRILTPLGLADTYLPPAGERAIRGPHPKGYQPEGDGLTDVSEIEPSVPWAAGAIVSTGADIDAFYLALLDGRLLAPVQLDDMVTGSPDAMGPGFGYGIGLTTFQLACPGGATVDAVGHSGGISGYYSFGAATTTGGAVTYAFTSPPDEVPDMRALLTPALC